MEVLESFFLQSLKGYSPWVFLLAFIGGFISSLLPCALGMLPVMVGYIGGYSHNKRDVFVQVTLFVLGVAVVMTVLGIAASLLGVAFGGLVGSNVYYFLGILAILAGLQLLEIIHLPLPQGLTRLPETKAGSVLAPFILGMAFGVASSPCGSAFLAAILTFISREQNLVFGGISLFCYALGQGVILLVAGLFTGLLKHKAAIGQFSLWVNNISGWLFILAGVLIILQGAGILGDILIQLGWV
ncbi:MAG: cytochrome c biogenesis protein CcdA [Vampirovibrio sp.]|nr:cytochrome c biogenesis protein CcdA [Vampirovibrio sp.]